MRRLLASGLVVVGLLTVTAVSAFVGIHIAGTAIGIVARAGGIDQAIAAQREAIRLDPAQAEVLNWRSAARRADQGGDDSLIAMAKGVDPNAGD